MNNYISGRILESLCSIAVIIVVVLNYYQATRGKRGTSFLFFVFFILLYSLFYRPLDGDFWSYLETYSSGASFSTGNLEEYYVWLMRLIPNNYLLWRIAIWLPAAIMLAYVFRMMKIPPSYATVAFLVFGLAAFYYTRNALALAVLYLGLSVYCQNEMYKNKKWAFLVFVGIAFISWFLHKSMPLYIGIAIIAIFLPFHKNMLWIALASFPILYGLSITLGSELLSFTQIWLSEDIGTNYLDAESADWAYNWKGIIQLAIIYAPIVYFYFISFLHPVSRDSEDFTFFKVFYIYSFIVIYISFLFYEQGSIAIQRRIYKSAMIPFSFVVSLYFKHYMRTEKCRYFVYLTIFSIVFPYFISLIR